MGCQNTILRYRKNRVSKVSLTRERNYEKEAEGSPIAPSVPRAHQRVKNRVEAKGKWCVGKKVEVLKNLRYKNSKEHFPNEGNMRLRGRYGFLRGEDPERPGCFKVDIKIGSADTVLTTFSIRKDHLRLIEERDNINYSTKRNLDFDRRGKGYKANREGKEL